MARLSRERNRQSQTTRMPYRQRAILHRTREVRRTILRQFVVISFLQVDHDEQSGIRCADVGSQIYDGVHPDHPASAHREAPLLADISRTPGVSQRPSGRMITYGSASRFMGCGKVVAVELLFERAVLLSHIDSAANGYHTCHFIHRANDAYGYRILTDEFNRRNILRAIKHLQVGREQSVVARSGTKAERLQHPEAFLGHWPRIEVDAAIKRRRDFLQDERYRRREGTLGMDRPDIDSRGPFRLPGDERKIGIARIKTAVHKPAHAFVRQRQDGEKPLAFGTVYFEMITHRDCQERARIVIYQRLYDTVRSNTCI